MYSEPQPTNYDRFRKDLGIVRQKRLSRPHLAWEELIDLNGGTKKSVSFETDVPTRAIIKQQMRARRLEVKATQSTTMKETGELFEKFVRWNGQPKNIFTDLLPLAEDFDPEPKYIQHLWDLSNETNQAEAIQFINLWTMPKNCGIEIACEKSNLATALLLKEVDDAMSGCFLMGMDSLLHHLFHPNPRIEIIVSGIDETTKFHDYVQANRHNLPSIFDGELNGPEGTALAAFLRRFANWFNYKFEHIEKVSGKENGKIIGTTRRNELLASYKKQNVEGIPKPVAQQKEWAKQRIMNKLCEGQSLTHKEREYFATLGNRVILTRREELPKAPTEHARDSLIRQAETELEAEFL